MNSYAGYIFNKTRSSLEANTVNILVCLCSWLSANIWSRKCLCYSLSLTKTLGEMSYFGQYMQEQQIFFNPN